jgi:CHAD domain-containing protein
LLGAVRDLDVLTARFRKAAADVAPPGSLAPLFDELASRHDRALLGLREGLRGDRYRRLLGAIGQAVDHPSPGDSGGVPCREALPPRAAAAWRRLKKAARALRPGDPDEDFHEVRKRAKRARYTAEMVAPVLSGAAAKGARRFIRGATRVQDVLGEHQDAIVAGQVIAGLLARDVGRPAFERAAHRLVEGQAEAATAAREAFFKVWDRLDRKKARRWLASKG